MPCFIKGNCERIYLVGINICFIESLDGMLHLEISFYFVFVHQNVVTGKY